MEKHRIRGVEPWGDNDLEAVRTLRCARCPVKLHFSCLSF